MLQGEVKIEITCTKIKIEQYSMMQKMYENVTWVHVMCQAPIIQKSLIRKEKRDFKCLRRLMNKFKAFFMFYVEHDYICMFLK